ncbi:MAG: hypothetical protein ACYDAG_06935, partial [Chloroflexota bacterium]
ATEDARRKDGSGLPWVAYFAAATACLYSQYIGAFVLLFQGVYVISFGRRRLLPFALASGAAVATFLPWLYVARTALLLWPTTSAFAGGPRIFGDAAFRFVEGLSATFSPLPLALTGIVCAIALVGAIRGRGGASPKAPTPATSQTQWGTWAMAGLAVLYLVVPIGAMFLLGLRKPLYNPKFALVALPAFPLLLGVGLRRLGAFAPLGLVLVLISAALSLRNYYFNPAFARDNYRGLAHFISTSERPGDAIILNAPGQEQIFPYYYHGPLPLIPLPADRPLIESKTAAELTRLNSRYKRLWLVLYGTNGSDPHGYVEHWLAGKDYEIQNQWFGNVRLTTFAVPLPGTPPSQPVAATLGGFAQLQAYGLNPTPVASGDVLQLGLRWKAVGQTATAYTVFTHVIDSFGNIWAQRDSQPVGGARPTSGWKTGQLVGDNYGLLVLPGTPPGQYRVELGMYDGATGKRLAVSAGPPGDRVVLPGVRVSLPARAPSLDELRIPHPANATFGPMRLLGFGLTLVGQDIQRTGFAPGDQIHLTLFWQCDRPSGVNRRITLRLIGGGRTIDLNGARGQILLAQHPTSTWRAGDRFRDQYTLTLPTGAHGGMDLVMQLDGGPSRKLAHLKLED